MNKLQRELQKCYIYLDHSCFSEQGESHKNPTTEGDNRRVLIMRLCGNIVAHLGESSCRDIYKKDKTLFDHDKYMFNAEKAIYDYTLFMIHSYINEKKLNKSLDF